MEGRKRYEAVALMTKLIATKPIIRDPFLTTDAIVIAVAVRVVCFLLFFLLLACSSYTITLLMLALATAYCHQDTLRLLSGEQPGLVGVADLCLRWFFESL